jgi:(p)ppGpp synthase/HD superfamily hydrolase
MKNTNIRLTVKDRIGLVNEVMKILSDLDIMVYNHKADVFQDNCKHIQVATFKLSLEFLSADKLDVLLKRFGKLKGTISVDVL